MFVKAPRLNNIIYFDTDVSRIVDDNDSHFLYSIDFYANVVNAIIQGCNTVRVTAYSEDPFPVRSTFGGISNSKQMTGRMKMAYAVQRTRNLDRLKNIISRRYVDITGGINNSIASKISSNPDNANLFLPMKTIVRVEKKSDTDILGKKYSNLSTMPLTLPGSGMTSSNLRSSAINAIFKAGQSPSKVQNASFPMIGSSAARQGFVGSQSSTRSLSRNLKFSRSQSNKSVSRISTKFQASSLRGNMAKIFNTLSSVKSPSDGRTLSRYRRSIIQRPIRHSGFDFIMPIRKRYLRGLSRFYIAFEAIDPKGVVRDRKVIKVSHSRKSDEYFRPKSPPVVGSGKSVLGINQLILRQTDPKAEEIYIYRRPIFNYGHDLSSRFRLVAKVELSLNDKAATYKDFVNNSRKYIYRVFAVGKGSRRSRRFDDVVAPAVLSKERVQRHVSITTESIEDTVRVVVSNIPNGACTVKVKVHDMTTRSPVRYVGSDLESVCQLVDDGVDEIIFDDLLVKDRHMYEYTPVVLFPDGQQIEGPEPVVQLFERNFQSKNIVLNISGENVGFNRQGAPTVKFKLESTFTLEGIDALIGSLKSAGISDQFTNDITKNRSKLNSLIAYEVLRKDPISGMTETFGVVTSDEFEDSPWSRLTAGVSDMVPGRVYTYEVTSLLRNPSTLFSQTSNESADVTSASDFAQKSFKFLNPLVTKSGTLPSTARSLGITTRSGIVTENEFLQGRTSVSSTVDILVPTSKTSMSQITASRRSDGNIVLTWDWRGPVDRIDHFLITARIDSVKSVLGAVAPEGEGQRFEFIDDQLALELGEVDYRVIPVFTNYIYGKESKAAPVKPDQGVPDFFLNV